MDELQVREIIQKKCFDAKYHNSLKYMIHSCMDREVRNRLLASVFIYDPYLAAKIYMTMCDSSTETLEFIEGILEQVKQHAKSQLKKTKLLMAYLELDRIEDFYLYYDKMYQHFEKKTYIYMAKYLTYEKLLYLMDAMIIRKQKKYYTICIGNLRHKYTPEYDDILMRILRDLFENEHYSECWKLLIGTRKEKYFRTMLGQTLTQDYIRQLIETGLNRPHKYGLFLSLKHGYSVNYDNSEEILRNVISDKTFMQGAWMLSFYTRFLRENELNSFQQELVLKKMGFAKDIVDACMANGAFESVMNLKKINSKQIQKLKENPEILEQQLVESMHTMLYPFSAREKISFREEDYSEDKSALYALFEQHMSKENDPKRIAFLYFNSLFRYLVNLEYVVVYLRQRFSLNVYQLRDLFKDYILFGRVIKINENSVSIRIKNVLTVRPCRMNHKKCHIFRNGEAVNPQPKDDIYFHFDYIFDDGTKINVHFPAFTVEEMLENDKRKRLRRDNEDANRRKN